MGGLLLPAAVALLGGLIFGYELGIISGALLQLKLEFLLSCFQQEALVSALLAGALAGALGGGFLIDRCGRRTSILASNVVLLSGSAVLSRSASLWWLLVGRGAVGLAVSVSSAACCIYVSEVVRPQRRGALVSLYEAGVAAGVLFSYGASYVLPGWRSMLGLPMAPALLQVISLWFLPSDPPPASELESECGLLPLQDLAQDLGASSSPTRGYSFLDLFGAKDNMRRRTAAGAGLVLFQQLTGQPNLLYYASSIFRSAGFQSDRSAVLASVGLGAVKVLSTLVAMSCADKAGRRVLLLTGCALMTVSITAIGCAGFMIQLDAHKSCEVAVAQDNVSALWSTTGRGDSMEDLAASLQMRDRKVSASAVTGASRGWEKHPGATDSASGVTGASRGWVMHSGATDSASGVTGASRGWVKHSGATDNASPVTGASREQVKHSGATDSASGVTSASRRQVKHSDAAVAVWHGHAALHWITLLSLMAFVSAFSVGFGPMTWLVLSEIYPTEVRGRAFAFCNSLNWAANLLISLTFLDVIQSVGLAWTFLLHGIMGVAAIIFIYIFIPETKGRTLQEVDALFLKKRFLSESPIWRMRGRSQSGHRYRKMDQSSACDSQRLLTSAGAED